MNVVKGCFKLLRGILGRLQEGIRVDVLRLKSFKDDLLSNASIACSYMACATAATGFFVLFTIYIVNGGYPAQIEAIKTHGMDSIEGAFTSGTVPMMYQPVLGGIMLFLLSLSIVFMLVEYFLSSSVVKKIAMAVDLLLLAAFSAVFTVVVTFLDNPPKNANEGFSLWLTGILSSAAHENTEVLLLTPLALLAVTIIVLIVLADKRIVGRILISAVFSFGILPLTLLIIENLLIFVYVIIWSVCFYFVLMLIGSVLSSAMRESGEAAESAPAESQQKSAGKQDKAGVSKARVVEIAANQKIYIDEGNGVAAPMTKCIFTDTSLVNHKFLCTLKDYQSGKVRIKRGGREINQSDF